MPTLKPVLLLFFLSAASLLSPTTLLHAEWQAGSVLSAAGQDGNAPQIAVSADGTRAVAVWSRFEGSSFKIQAKAATISGASVSWGSTADLSGSGTGTFASVAISSDGSKAIVAWMYNVSGTQSIQAATASISGNSASWSSPIDISATGNGPGFPVVRLSADGMWATAAWTQSDGITPRARSASASISSNVASWGAVSDLSFSGGTASNVKLQISSDGTKASATWDRDDGSNYIVQLASASISGNSASWGFPSDVSQSGQDGTAPDIALSASGSAGIVAWQGSGSNVQIRARAFSLSGTSASFGAIATLSDAGQNAEEARVVCSSDAALFSALWIRSDGSNNRAQSISGSVSSLTISGGSVSSLSPALSSASFGSIVLSSSGSTAVAIWDRASVEVQSARASISGTSATWGSATVISSSSVTANQGTLSFSSDAQTGIAAYRETNGVNLLARAALYASAPTPTPTPSATPTATAAPSATPTATATPTAVPTTTLIPASVCVYGDGTFNDSAYKGDYPKVVERFSITYERGNGYPYVEQYSIGSRTWYCSDRAGAPEYSKPAATSPIGTYTSSAGRKLYVIEGPCPSVSPTPLPATNQVTGMVQRPEGSSGSTLSASLISTGTSPRSATKGPHSSAAEDVIQTVLVQADGSFTFSAVAAGEYRVVFSGGDVSFEPAELSVTLVDGENVSTPSIEGTEVDYQDTGCKVTDKGEAVFNAAEAARKIRGLLTGMTSFVASYGAEKLTESKASALSKLYENSGLRAGQIFNRIYTFGKALPTVVRLACPKANSCSLKNYANTVASYRKQVAALNRQVNQTLAKSKKFFKKRKDAVVFTTTQRSLKKLYKASLAKAKLLPTKSQACPLG